MDPTCAVLEERMTKLEGGAAGMAIGSGQAASAFAIQNICHSGDNFISSTDLWRYLEFISKHIEEMGIECRLLIHQNLKSLKTQ